MLFTLIGMSIPRPAFTWPAEIRRVLVDDGSPPAEHMEWNGTNDLVGVRGDKLCSPGVTSPD